MADSPPGDAPRPWWYSGGAQPHAEESAFSALAGTAQAVVAWARQAFIDPHASHEVPGEHPECMLCRAVGTVRDLLNSVGPEDSTARPEPASPIEWIEVTVDPGRDDPGP